MKTLSFILLPALLCFPINVRFTDMPETYRLYPRGADNHGTVVISGMVLEAGRDSVIVRVTRNGLPYDYRKTPLAYQGDSAAFSFTLPIPAEMAEFGFRCLVDTETAASADSVVAGDVFLVGGQSNTNNGGGEWREYVRTIALSTDTGWALGSEGSWTQQIGRLINENHGIPVCLMNGGVWGSSLAGNQRKVADPYSGIYGALLTRVTRAKVQNDIKAIIWYQGESEAGYGAEISYPAEFDRLVRSWKEDYPGFRKILIFQINTWLNAGAREVREGIRRISHLYGDSVEIMSTLGIPGYNGHYSGNGYYVIGERMYRLVEKEFYNTADTADIRPSEIQRAYYSSGARDEIILDFDQSLRWTGAGGTGENLRDYFALNDSDWLAVDSCWFENNNRRIVLKLKAPSAATTISYMRDWYDLISSTALYGPCLMNGRDVAALTFAKFPLEAADYADTASMTGFELVAPKTTLALFEPMQLWGIASLAGGITDTNRNVLFLTPDTFVLRVERDGHLRAMNPGTARVVATRGALTDTLLITVDNLPWTMQSMSFRPAERRLMAGDSMAVGLFGNFPVGTTPALYALDTLAIFEYDAGSVRIENGMIYALAQNAGTPITASLAGQRCTLSLEIPAAPSFVKRINFQLKGQPVKAIPGWSIDSSDAYSTARGFGWENYDYRGATNAALSNWLKATCLWHIQTGYRVDCPDGNYLLRVCIGQYPYLEPGHVRLGNDTLSKNPQGHAADGSINEMQLWTSDSRITVTGGAGLNLNIYGGICYLVLVSDDGAELDQVAKDKEGQFTADPLYTETGKGYFDQALFRRPMACPNPFNPVTTVRFSLPAGVSAEYSLYEIRGKRVWTALIVKSDVVRRQTLTVGANRGKGFASGCYFGRLECSDNRKYVHRMVMIK